MIRPATPADVPAIRAILNRVIRDTTITFTTTEKTPADVIAMLNGPTPVLVTTTNDHVTGYATFGPFRAGPGYARTAEHSIALDPAAHGRGQGRALLRTLEQAAAEHGITQLIAGISAENTPALAFHTACGYAKVAHLPAVGHKFGRDLDLILMQKPLAPTALSR